MFSDWAFARRGCGVIVVQAEQRVTVLEFNEFLGRISSGVIGAEDIVVAPVFTDGVRRRVGDLRIYEMVRSGAIRTDDLPRRVPEGVLAAGAAAHALLRAVEQRPDADTLLRAVAPQMSVTLPREMLRAAVAAWSADPPDGRKRLPASREEREG